jgi:hypothetical protein
MIAMWNVVFADEFESEYATLDDDVQDELLVHANVIRAFGPLAKEWRVAFAFDRRRQAVLLVAADKSGLGPSKAQKKFYDELIAKADARFGPIWPELNRDGAKRWPGPLKRSWQRCPSGDGPR